MNDTKNLKEIINHRLKKLNSIKENNINPFPYKFDYNVSIIDVNKDEKKYLSKNISIAGRVLSIRMMGKSSFMNLQDENDKIQLFINKNNIDEGMYENIVKKLDTGDIIGVFGEVFYTRTEQLSLKVKKIELLSKSVRPLPNIKEKDGISFFAYEDKEQRYRKRYLDLIINPDVTKNFKLRSEIINNIRAFLNKNQYLEVETPILQPQYGGANAKPFITHHNKLDQEFYLRIADELYLKRLIIGGINKVYEVSKNFRNEGMDRNHNPEFTMLEFYCAYADVYDMMETTENLIKSIIKNTDISSKLINLKNKFDVFDYFEIINKYVSGNIKNMNEEKLHELLKKHNVEIDKNSSYGKLLDKVFSVLVEPELIKPTFIINYPLEISPLAKINRDGNKDTVERFELFINGMEIANSFSELNDPIEQRLRLEKQNKLRDLGDEEAQLIDEDFLEAMEYGMPPCGGVGIGIDRLVMILTNQNSIKDVILFPALRSKVN